MMNAFAIALILFFGSVPVLAGQTEIPAKCADSCGCVPCGCALVKCEGQFDHSFAVIDSPSNENTGKSAGDAVKASSPSN